MSGSQLRLAREREDLTQQQAARRWRVSQPYLSLMERGHRRVPDRLARLVGRAEPDLATALPLRVPTKSADELPKLLGSLGYPPYEYLADRRSAENPAAVVFTALASPGVSARVTEALPWVLTRFSDLDWNWLLQQVKLANLQNRLGFLVSLAKQVAEAKNDPKATKTLTDAYDKLEAARLAKEDTLGREMTQAEREYLRQHRPDGAAYWNLLTSLRVENLRYGF